MSRNAAASSRTSPLARAQHKPRAPRIPRRARLGDPPLLRRVGNELVYTPTRCRVSASLLVGRVNPWWLRLASPPTSGA
ncbi:hypothetical protein PPN31119_00847 [Pandoraea pnomenusa]|uniref:Uncharacterized protein n=1 Tax=Pandoraea pnomenusa TaxID=93220 RepID=A0ABY6WH90_9BURK|nr:hypothetical protein PPN31119_00847 [Pandoraea pnomenusa]